MQRQQQQGDGPRDGPSGVLDTSGGRWTDEEHQGFLHGLEVYGYGNWDAIAVFVPSRSPPQIEAYAQQYVAQVRPYTLLGCA
ncbi:MYB DNA binding protein/ transcription factor-like protein [Ectocarpus siliculosus]|uniref:MYB DNA binding protein/ transcription factor-like protein n=1 Tax=Ectocarpus siliculosus TaxID=2880 RepID=D7G876_ECTSI|nr:MYB DNA binding protein/ transcription factor-like protein [Ectocarpus siliculosus]|eukprot:CBJ27939.1 MYB DNA binding protein/ transcription factor-like protein [Ectocarpus siliculosus]